MFENLWEDIHIFTANKLYSDALCVKGISSVLSMPDPVFHVNGAKPNLLFRTFFVLRQQARKLPNIPRNMGCRRFLLPDACERVQMRKYYKNDAGKRVYSVNCWHFIIHFQQIDIASCFVVQVVHLGLVKHTGTYRLNSNGVLVWLWYVILKNNVAIWLVRSICNFLLCLLGYSNFNSLFKTILRNSRKQSITSYQGVHNNITNNKCFLKNGRKYIIYDFITLNTITKRVNHNNNPKKTINRKTENEILKMDNLHQFDNWHTNRFRLVSYFHIPSSYPVRTTGSHFVFVMSNIRQRFEKDSTTYFWRLPT